MKNWSFVSINNAARAVHTVKSIKIIFKVKQLSMFKIISFDMEGTLIDHTYSNTIWEIDIPKLYAKKYGLDLRTAKKKVISEYKTVGDAKKEWYDIAYWYRRFGFEADWRDLAKNRSNLVNVYPDANQALNLLQKCYCLIVSSNTIRDFLNIQVKVVGNYFTHIFSAPSDFNIVKKDSQFYRRIISELSITPDELVHIGDNYNYDYIAARELGVKAFYLDRANVTIGADVVHDLNMFIQKLKDS